MRLRLTWPAVVLLILILVPAAFACSAAQKDVVGWVEKGIIMHWGVVTKMKLDTGALTSSMQAEHIKEFERDGDKWVRFEVEIENEATNKKVRKTFERKIQRRVKLRGAGGVDHRVAVLMEICIGNKIHAEQFTLKDRDGFNYPVLLGRRTIKHLGYIDVNRTFTVDPTCKVNSHSADHNSDSDQ